MREEKNNKAVESKNESIRGKPKQQVTMNLNKKTVEYFKKMSEETGIPYQVLINVYLDQCVKEKKKLQFI